jgi:hypothetical protein
MSKKNTNKKLKAPLLKNFLLKKTPKNSKKDLNSNLTKLNANNSQPTKPILKPVKSSDKTLITKSFSSNISAGVQKQSVNLKTNLIYQKAKSAENLAKIPSFKSSSEINNSNKNKLLKNSISTTSLYTKKPNINLIHIKTPQKFTQEIINKTDKNDQFILDSNNEILSNNFDYFELLEFLTEKSKHLKLENRKLFISKIINLLTNSEQLNNETDLYSKLDQMKTEIDHLKKQIEANRSSSTPPINAKNLGECERGEDIGDKQKNDGIIPHDLSNALKMIISNYFEKLTKMQQQIDELNSLNKCLFYLETKCSKDSSNIDLNNESSQKLLIEIEKFRQLVERLENELNLSSEKCAKLESLLDEKSQQTEQYIQLFK